MAFESLSLAGQAPTQEKAFESPSLAGQAPTQEKVVESLSLAGKLLQMGVMLAASG
jgi:hypothetical protein